MKLTANTLRKIIESIVKEAPESPTISADLDKEEEKFKKSFPKWGDTKATQYKFDSPTAIKAKQVKQILKNLGYTRDPKNQKAIVMWLNRFIDTMYEPDEIFELDPRDIAKDFAKKFLTS